MTLTVPHAVHSLVEFQVCWDITNGTPGLDDMVAVHEVGAPWYNDVDSAETGGAVKGCTKLVAPVGGGPVEVRYRPHETAEAVAASKPSWSSDTGFETAFSPCPSSSRRWRWGAIPDEQTNGERVAESGINRHRRDQHWPSGS